VALGGRTAGGQNAGHGRRKVAENL
jgi:hypothetical protein